MSKTEQYRDSQLKKIVILQESQGAGKTHASVAAAQQAVAQVQAQKQSEKK
jgi:hypothetical protein